MLIYYIVAVALFGFVVAPRPPPPLTTFQLQCATTTACGSTNTNMTVLSPSGTTVMSVDNAGNIFACGNQNLCQKIGSGGSQTLSLQGNRLSLSGDGAVFLAWNVSGNDAVRD